MIFNSNFGQLVTEYMDQAVELQSSISPSLFHSSQQLEKKLSMTDKNLEGLKEREEIFPKILSIEEEEEYLKKFTQERNFESLTSLLEENRVERSQLIKLAIQVSITVKDIIQIAEKIGDQQLFKDYVHFFHTHFKRGPTDELFYDLFNPESLNEFKEGLEKGYPLTTWTIDQVFYSYNYAFIHLILQHVSDEWLEQNAAYILQKLMELEEPKMGELVIQRFPQLLSKGSLFPLLSKAISERRAWFVEWAFTNSGKLTLDEMEQLLPSAVESCHLKIIKILCQQIEQQSGQSALLYPQVLGLEKIQNDKLLQQVTAFAILSPLSDLYELAAFYPQIGKVLPEAVEIASVLVRFPNTQYAKEINSKYKDVSNYIENSRVYAQENLDFIKYTLPQLNQLTRDQLLDEMILNRYQRMAKEKKKPDVRYKNKQINSPKATSTPLKYIKTEEFDMLYIPRTIGFNRYGWAIRHFAHLSFNWNNQEWQLPQYPSIIYEKLGKQIQYFYSFKDSTDQPRDYLLTSFNSDLSKWHHTKADTIKDLQEHLETLHREIVDFPLTASNQQEFFQKVARSYWLIATLCETLRGTPHNAMIWLNLIYQHHNLPLPIPKIDHFFLDNTMLMYPFEKAIEEWQSFFEPTLDQVLETMPNGHKHLEDLLQQNGLLLRFCSEKIRSDRSLALLAVQQDPEARKYVAKELLAEGQ